MPYGPAELRRPLRPGGAVARSVLSYRSCSRIKRLFSNHGLPGARESFRGEPRGGIVGRCAALLLKSFSFQIAEKPGRFRDRSQRACRSAHAERKYVFKEEKG